jgi:thioredoxin 1
MFYNNTLWSEKMASELTPAVTDTSFQQDVIESDVPVVVDFWATWCKPCLAIAPMLEEAASEYQGRLKIVKVDVTNNRGIATKYGIRNIPCLILFDGENEVARHVGALNRGAFDAFAGKAL